MDVFSWWILVKFYTKFYSFANRKRRSPDQSRSASPRTMHSKHDVGFSDTASNVVEMVRHEHVIRRHPHRSRGKFVFHNTECSVEGPEYFVG